MLVANLLHYNINKSNKKWTEAPSSGMEYGMDNGM